MGSRNLSFDFFDNSVLYELHFGAAPAQDAELLPPNHVMHEFPLLILILSPATFSNSWALAASASICIVSPAGLDKRVTPRLRELGPLRVQCDHAT